MLLDFSVLDKDFDHVGEEVIGFWIFFIGISVSGLGSLGSVQDQVLGWLSWELATIFPIQRLDFCVTPRQRSDLYIRISVSGLRVGIGFQH